MSDRKEIIHELLARKADEAQRKIGAALAIAVPLAAKAREIDAQAAERGRTMPGGVVKALVRLLSDDA